MVDFFFGILSESFIFLLSFLLVFTIFYATLSKLQVVSKNKGVNSVISFTIAFMFALSGAFKFFIRVIPFFALMIAMFAGLFIVLSLLGIKTDELIKSAFVRWTLIIMAVLFIALTGWNMYYDDIQEQIQLLTLENVTIDEAELSANLTGNPFRDIPLRYEYQCSRGGRYLSPILYFGEGGIFCIMMHPKIISLFFIIPILAGITYVIPRHSFMPDKKKE